MTAKSSSGRPSDREKKAANTKKAEEPKKLDPARSISVADLARETGMGEQKIRRKVNEGKWAAHKDGRHMWFDAEQHALIQSETLIAGANQSPDADPKSEKSRGPGPQ